MDAEKPVDNEMCAKESIDEILPANASVPKLTSCDDASKSQTVEIVNDVPRTTKLTESAQQVSEPSDMIEASGVVPSMAGTTYSESAAVKPVDEPMETDSVPEQESKAVEGNICVETSTKSETLQTVEEKSNEDMDVEPISVLVTEDGSQSKSTEAIQVIDNDNNDNDSLDTEQATGAETVKPNVDVSKADDDTNCNIAENVESLSKCDKKQDDVKTDKSDDVDQSEVGEEVSRHDAIEATVALDVKLSDADDSHLKHCNEPGDKSLEQTEHDDNSAEQFDHGDKSSEQPEHGEKSLEEPEHGDKALEQPEQDHKSAERSQQDDESSEPSQYDHKSSEPTKLGDESSEQREHDHKSSEPTEHGDKSSEQITSAGIKTSSLDLELCQPQVKLQRSVEAEKILRQSEKESKPILNIPIVNPGEDSDSLKRPLSPSSSPSSSPPETPTKKSRSAGLDSVVSRLRERQTEPSFLVPGLDIDSLPLPQPKSPLKTGSSPPAGQKRTPPKVMDEYAKFSELTVKISLPGATKSSLSPKGQGRSPPSQRSPVSPFKSPLGDTSHSPKSTAEGSAFLAPKVSPPKSPRKSPSHSPSASPTAANTSPSKDGAQIMSFKEHIDALVTKELASQQLEEEKADTCDSERAETKAETETENEDKTKGSPKKKSKHMQRKRSKAKKDTPPKVSKVDPNTTDDNAMDVPDREATDTATADIEKAIDDESSQDASCSKSKSKLQKTPRKTAACSTLEELGKTQDDMGNAVFLADNVHEYQWPPDEKDGEWCLIQEQVSEYLGVKSFKRKYPSLYRRSISMKERNYLQEKGVVTEIQCDLGLTAVLTEEILDLMALDYPTKYKEFTTVLKERQRLRMLEKRKAAELLLTDKAKLEELRKKAIKSASEFNAGFMRELREERRAYLDMQTMEIHYPRNKLKTLAPECTKVGAYPVALIPGQYQDYYKRYSSSELKYLPLNTVSFRAPRKMASVYSDPNEQVETETDSDNASISSRSESESECPSAPSPAPMETNGSESSAVEKSSAPSVDKKLCKVCSENEDNKSGIDEEMLTCSECGAAGHPSCLELTESMVKLCRSYQWQCMECKTCVECMDPYDEDKMMFCDRCDRGYHTFCLGVRSIPTGRWECPSCKPRDSPKVTPKKRRPGRPAKRKLGMSKADAAKPEVTKEETEKDEATPLDEPETEVAAMETGE